MALASERVDSGIRFLDDDEARQQFDRQAQRLLGISGEELLRRYDAGDLEALQDDRQQRAVMKLAMLADLVR
jgi:PAS domain-containing protein